MRLEGSLERVAAFQKRNARIIVFLALLITLFAGYGVSKVEMQTDLSKEMPNQLPIYQLNDRISDKFQGQDTIFILLTLDEDLNIKGYGNDIREPLTMQYLMMLDEALSKESSVVDVVSGATYIKDKPIYTKELVKDAIENSAASSFFSDDYKATFMIVRSDIGSGEKKIVALSELINDKIEGFSTPPGVEVTITGNAPLRVVILGLLQSDAIFTVSLASLIILGLLFMMKRSFSKGFLIFIPLSLGLIWTMGTMGWLGLKLSIATAGVGAMILGLGVEYGVFMYSRYEEERDKGKSQLMSLKKAVPGVGSAVLGSGITTMAGFLALTLSIMPMLQKLGLTLALGIFFCLFSAVFVMPSIIIVEEDFEHWYAERKHKAALEKKEKLMQRKR